MNVEEKIISELFLSVGKNIMVQVNKYGIDIAVKTLENYLNTGDIKGFTRDFGCRENFSNLDYKDVCSKIMFVYSSLLVKEVCILRFVEDVVLSKAQALESSLVVNVNKYGELGFDGAVSKLRQNNFNGFTRDESARKNIINQGIDANNVEFFVKYGSSYGRSMKHNEADFNTCLQEYKANILRKSAEKKLVK